MASPTREMALNSLFGNTKFWVSQHVPQRTRMKEMIVQHGGIIVLLEKYAQIKLVDHTKKNLPSDSYSYQYVERSVRNGKLENLEDHRAGPSAQRPVGASHIPHKKTRSEYTLNDDQILFDWLYPYEQAGDAPVNGNKIYMELAEKFPQHTWQSWRARYIKTLRGRSRPGGGEPRPDFLQPVLETTTRLAPTTGRRVPKASTPVPTASKPASPALKRMPSASKLVPKPTLPRVPAQTEQNQAPKTSQTRPIGSGDSKRKRDLLTEPHENGRGEGSSAKRVLVGTAEAMDMLVQNLSHSDSRRRHKSSLQRATQKSPSQPSLSPEIPSHTTQLQPNAPATKTVSRPPQAPKTPTKDQNKTTKPRNPPQNIPDALFLELPFLPSSPEPEVEETDQESNLDVNDWIDAQLEQRNVELPLVLQALQCTSMNPEYAERVLEHCAAGKDIPTDMAGVWTADDDRCLEAVDGRAVKSVYEKHGSDLVNARWEYLTLARDGGIL